MNVTVTPQPFAWAVYALNLSMKAGQIILLPFRLLEGALNIFAGLLLVAIVAGGVALFTGTVKIPNDLIQDKMEQVFRSIDPDLPPQAIQNGLRNLHHINHQAAAPAAQSTTALPINPYSGQSSSDGPAAP